MKIVCVTGVDGSGKSTQIAALACRLGEQGKDAQRVSIWDGLTSESIRPRLPFPSRQHAYDYLEALTPLSRAYFLFHALRVSLDLAADRACDVLLLDGYWYKYYATEVAHGADKEAVRSMAAGFPCPDKTFYLDVDIHEAIARKVELSDYERGFGRGQRVSDFVRTSQAALDTLAIELRWHVLPGAAKPDQITKEVLDELQPERRPRG